MKILYFKTTNGADCYLCSDRICGWLVLSDFRRPGSSFTKIMIEGGAYADVEGDQTERLSKEVR